MINGPESIRASLALLPCMAKDGLRKTEPELTVSEFMDQLRLELASVANLSDEQISAYTEDESAWLEYKADGHTPLEALEADMEYWK